MPRNIVVANGKLCIALDHNMSIRDLFYPQVGLENHAAGHEFKTGVWVDGHFSWFGKDWAPDMKYMPDTLVGRCLAMNTSLRMRCEINDAIHPFLDIFMRKFTLQNIGIEARKVRLFFTHDFHVYGDAVGDTVMYESASKAIVHYKRRRYFLISGSTSQNEGMFQFATGYKESLNMEGTWKDAEDGELSGNPIAQGSVDSAISFEVNIEPGATETIHYWIACGKNLDNVQMLDARVKSIGIEQLLIETENYWSAWINRKVENLNVLPHDIIRLFKTSLFIMRAHVDSSGGVIASSDSDILQFNRDTYSYVWPRDGALVAIAFDLAGFQDVSRLFFQFCNQTITDKGFFHHKYSLDGSVGSSWLASTGTKGQIQLPIQEDETALVLYALWLHFQKYRDIEFVSGIYQNLVVKSTEFLLDYIDQQTGLPKPSFDIWEERTGVFTWTTAAVCAALNAAAGFAKVFYDRKRQEMLLSAALSIKKAMITNLYDPGLRRFIKAIYPDGVRDTILDSSIAGIFTLGVFDTDDETVVETINQLNEKLWVYSDIGGLARYEGDEYQRVSKSTAGNPWFVCTIWLARWYIAKARSFAQLKKGLDLLIWVAKHSLPSGVLAEQIDPLSGAPISVSPLVWSHAEYVIAVCEYLNKYRELSLLVR